MRHVHYMLGRLVTLAEGQAADISEIRRDVLDTQRRVRLLERCKTPPPRSETWFKLAGAIALPIATFWAAGDKVAVLEALSRIFGK